MKNAMSKRLTALCLALCLALPLAGCSSKEESSAANRLEAIKERGYIEVVTEPYFAPMEFIDPTKEGDEKYVGADIELAHHIADELGVECHIIPLDFTSVLSGVTTGKYDMAISALAYTPERAEAMELSDGYYYGTEDTGYGLMVRTEDLAAITSADDLGDKTVVVQSGSIQESFLNEQVLPDGTGGQGGCHYHRHQYRPALSGCQPELRHEHCAGLPVRGGRIHQGHPDRCSQGRDRTH